MSQLLYNKLTRRLGLIRTHVSQLRCARRTKQITVVDREKPHRKVCESAIRSLRTIEQHLCRRKLAGEHVVCGAGLWMDSLNDCRPRETDRERAVNRKTHSQDWPAYHPMSPWFYFPSHSDPAKARPEVLSQPGSGLLAPAAGGGHDLRLVQGGATKTKENAPDAFLKLHCGGYSVFFC